MVVLAKGELEQIALPSAQPPLANVRAVDLSSARSSGPGRAAAARALVAACEEQGFFKVTGHGVAPALVHGLEAAAAAFFALPQAEKEAAAGRPVGYASKRIGTAGDLGWIEYLLLCVAPGAGGALPVPASASFSTLPCAAAAAAAAASMSGSKPSCPLRGLLEEYAAALRRMACEVLELMAEGLGLVPTDAISRLVSDAGSDNMLRVNHYPPRPELQLHGKDQVAVTGFGEHTDPQIISVLRSNGTSGLEIASPRDGAWASVPPDGDSFFINVGDVLQVLTNGRFRSVKHRVVVNSERPRMSMIFFGGPPPGERLAPLRELLGDDGGRSRYREFTWKEYKSTGCKGRLAADRLCLFENEDSDPCRLTSSGPSVSI